MVIVADNALNSIILEHYIKRKNNFQLENKQQQDPFLTKNYSNLEIKKHHFFLFTSEMPDKFFTTGTLELLLTCVSQKVK